jgi:hypothetical protein
MDKILEETIFKKAAYAVKEHKEKQKENIKNSVFKKIKGFLDSNNIDTGKKPNIKNDEVFEKINQKLKDFGFSPFKSYDLPSPSIDASKKLKEITKKLLQFDNEFYKSALIRPVSNEVIGFLKYKIIPIAVKNLKDMLDTVKEERYDDDDFEEEPKNQALLNNFKHDLIPIAVKNLKDMLDTRRGETYDEDDFEEETYDDIIEEKIDYKDAFKENLTEIAKTNLKLIFDSNLKNIKGLKRALEGVVDVVKQPIKIEDIVVFKLNEEDKQDKWYIGKITGVNNNGTYDINVGNIRYNVPSHSVVGVKDIIGCKAKYNGRTCKITRVNDDGTVTIEYDDDNVAENISDDIIIEETEILNILENNIPGLSFLLNKSSEKIEELTKTIVKLEKVNEEVIEKQQELIKNQEKLEKVNEEVIKKQSDLESEMNRLESNQRVLEDANKELSDNQRVLRDANKELSDNQNKLRDDLRDANKKLSDNQRELSDKIDTMVNEIYNNLEQITSNLHNVIINNRELMQNIKEKLKEELEEELKKVNDIITQYRNQLNRYRNQLDSIIDTTNNPRNVFTFNTSSELNDTIQKLTKELNNLKEELEKLKKDRNTVLGYKLSTLASNMLKRKLDSIVTNKNNLVNQNPQLKKQVELLLEAQTLYPHVLLSIYQQELTQKESELKKAIEENTITKGENAITKGENAKATQVNNEQTTIINNLENEMNQLKKRLAELEKEKSKNSLANILKKIAMTNLISVLNKPTPIEDGDVVMTEYYNDNENKQNKIESIKVF